MASIRHPLSQAVYDNDLETGGVVVTDRDGKIGLFSADGDWLSGECRSADPELCRWVAGPRFASRHRAAIEQEEPFA